MVTQSGTLVLADAQLHYESAGSGYPLVLIHGYGLDLRMWDDQYLELAQNYRVIRYDVRGFGKSTQPTDSYSNADDLKALLTHLGISQAHVMGLSMGGWIATNFALTYPAMTRALIVVDSALIGYDWSPEWRERWDRMHDAARKSGPQAANQLWLEHPLFAPARENPDVASRLAQMVNDYSGWHWVNDDPHRRIDPPDRERLNQISVPALIILGESDLPDFHTIAAILQEGIPNARTSILPKVGHMANMEEPVQFNQIVNDFLSSI